MLFGAELSYTNLNVDKYKFEAETKSISPFNKKILMLYILKLLVKNFQKGEAPSTPGEISKNLQIPDSLVRSILNDLEAVGLVSETRTDHTKKSAYQPAIDIHIIRNKNVLERLDKKGMDVLIARPSPALNTIKTSLQDFYAILEKSDQNKLLKDL
ncbi:MAG: winged helix-turn-helix domain-containing protein [Bacillota bacterium]